jgi:hypothetical protein
MKKMANQGSARLCCENITGLKFGDLYRQRTQKKKDIQNNSEFSALFYDSKNYYKFGSKESQLITDKEQIATYWHGTAGI